MAADRVAHETQRGKPHGRGHVPHLTVAAFRDHDFKPRRRDGLAEPDRRITRPEYRLGDAPCLGRLSSLAIEDHAAAQSFQRFFIRFAFHLGPILLGQLETRIGQALLQLAVVGEQQQSFAVPVEPPGRIDARHLYIGGQGFASVGVGELGQHAIGFVEENQPGHGRSVPRSPGLPHRTASDDRMRACFPAEQPMSFTFIKVPAGEKIAVKADHSLIVPDRPIIPFIEGDGTGRDITPVMRKVVDAAVAKDYGGKRSIAWMEVYAGEKAVAVYGNDAWLPDETLRAVKDYVVSIKGPLTTPVGGGIRSLNVTLRQELDLYVCLRPGRYFKGVPSPVKQPEKGGMVIFRENSEDIYAGIEWPSGSPEAQKVIAFLQREMGVKKIRFPETSAIGIN